MKPSNSDTHIRTPHLTIELLWFAGCPSHHHARELLKGVLRDRGLPEHFADREVSDSKLAIALRFAGSPTIRVNGIDVEPEYEDMGDYSMRCRLYLTDAGLTSLPQEEWIREALDQALLID
jgi:hypothetical protein